MNLNFPKIAEFCTTKTQIRKIATLQKKYSFGNAKARENVNDLFSSFFANETYEPFVLLLPELLQVEFQENFEIWGDVEYLLGLANETPVITDEQCKQSFLQLKSVTEYKSTKQAQEGLDNYFKNQLSLYFLNETSEYLQEAIKDNDSKMEYFMRIGLISRASVVKIINQNADLALTEKMNAIIAEQKSALRDSRLLKHG